MRKELICALMDAIRGIEEIRHVDLWNNNVIFATDDQPWQTPAVFIELHPVQWDVISKDPLCYGARRQQFSLHIVTDYAEGVYDYALNFALSEAIERVVIPLYDKDASFGNIQLLQSTTSHDHEDILECVDTYTYSGIRATTPKNETR